MFDFRQLDLASNFGLFALAAVAVWLAGWRVARYASVISDKTGLGHALIGLLLLAGVTSLPEIGVTVSAAASGDTKLAVNNLLGSIAMQIAVLAVIDFVIGRSALTSVAPDSTIMLQGALNVLLLSVAAAGVVVGDVAFLGVGAWAWACLAGYVGAVWLLSETSGRRPWLPTHARSGEVDWSLLAGQAGAHDKNEGGLWDEPLSFIIAKTIAAAAVIFVAGYALSQTGSAIAEQTGIGSSFVGYVLVAISTSLPELSSSLSAARLGLVTLAIANVFGTNLINVGLVFLVDAVAAGGPALNSVGSFSVFGALLGVIMTAMFMAGLAERRDRTVWRLGVDSFAVLLSYALGLILLYGLR